MGRRLKLRLGLLLLNALGSADMGRRVKLGRHLSVIPTPRDQEEERPRLGGAGCFRWFVCVRLPSSVKTSAERIGWAGWQVSKQVSK